MREESG